MCWAWDGAAATSARNRSRRSTATGGPFEDEVIKTENTNKAFFERFFSDEEFRDAVVAGDGGELHRRGGTDELAA